MYINKPEHFIVPVNSVCFDDNLEKLMRSDDDDYDDYSEVKIDVPMAEFNSVLENAKRETKNLFLRIYKLADNKLTSQQIAELHVGMMKEIFIETIKRVDFLEPLRLVYLKDDVKQWTDMFEKVYAKHMKAYGCEKYNSTKKVVSDAELLTIQIQIAKDINSVMKKIYDDADDFSIPQVIDLLKAFWLQIFELHVEYVPCFKELKDKGSIGGKTYEELKAAHIKKIDQYIVGALNEAKSQELKTTSK